MYMENVTWYEKWELISMDNVDLNMKRKIMYP